MAKPKHARPADGQAAAGLADQMPAARRSAEQALKAAEPLARRADARVLNALPGARREEFMESLRAIVSVLERMAPAK